MKVLPVNATGARTLLAASAVALSACVPTTNVSVQPTRLTAAQLEKAKTLAVQNFKDPASAQFRNLTTYKVATGDTVLCGEVNAKNSFGGYVGFRSFYARFEGNTLKRFFNNDGDGSTLASEACATAAKGSIPIATSEL